MTVVLRVLSGARIGHVLTSDAELIGIGRDEGLELRFDPQQDLSVSARHATIARTGEGWTLTDSGSRNGTFVNDELIDRPVYLRDGDRITFGAGGPQVEFRVIAVDATRAFSQPVVQTSAGAATAERVRVEVRRRTRHWSAVVAGLAIVLLAAVGALLLAARQQRQEWDRERAAMLAQIDSAMIASEQTIQLLQGELDGLAGALRESQQQVRTAGAALQHAQLTGNVAQIPALRSQLQGALDDLGQHSRAAGIDHNAIRSRNDRAVARVYVESAAGEVATGTAFAVRPDGTLLTSAHILTDASGSMPRRIAVQFSFSDQVWSGRVLAADDALDLAVLKVDGIIGRVPTVQGLNVRSDTLSRGEPVLLIGYPRGTELAPSDRIGRTIIRPATAAGSLASVTREEVEVEGYGTSGSSGSPVFDRNGDVIAIIFGGHTARGVHYLVAVPAAAAVRLLERITPAQR